MSTDLSHDDEIAAALVGIHNRLDILASINAANILIPGGTQERYHEILEKVLCSAEIGSITVISTQR